MDLGARLEEHPASLLGWVVWASTGLTMMTFGGFVTFMSLGEKSIGAGAFGLIVLGAGGFFLFDSVVRRRGSKLDIHQYGVAFSSAGRCKFLRSGHFTVLDAVSFRGMAPTMKLVEDETRITLPTRWFPDGWQLSHRISAMQTATPTRPEVAVNQDLVGRDWGAGAKFAALLLAGIGVSVVLFGGVILIALLDG
jgi:hypothetical protein